MHSTRKLFCEGKMRTHFNIETQKAEESNLDLFSLPLTETPREQLTVLISTVNIKLHGLTGFSKSAFFRFRTVHRIFLLFFTIQQRTRETSARKCPAVQFKARPMIIKENGGSMNKANCRTRTFGILYLEGIEFSKLSSVKYITVQNGNTRAETTIVYPPSPPLKKTSETEEICLRVKSDFFLLHGDWIHYCNSIRVISCLFN